MPHRSRVQGAHEFLVDKGIEHDERDIFEFFSVTQRSVYRMIEPGAPSRTHANSGALETRGRKRKVTSEQVREVDAILQDDALGLEGKALTWDQLATEVGADVCGRTIYKIMSDALDYGKHLACMKGWLTDRAKAYRQEWATVMYRKYPKPADWHRVRFSDEVHFGYGPEGQLRIIRRPGTRYRHWTVLKFDPPFLPKVAIGQKIHFDFRAANHTLTESSLADPCTKLGGTTVDTNFQNAKKADIPELKPFDLVIDSDRPRYFYCKQGNKAHCAKGMVFSVNTDEATFRQFEANAKAVAPTLKIKGRAFTA